MERRRNDDGDNDYPRQLMAKRRPFACERVMRQSNRKLNHRHVQDGKYIPFPADAPTNSSLEKRGGRRLTVRSDSNPKRDQSWSERSKKKERAADRQSQRSV